MVIRVAITGAGNCASALVQGVERACRKGLIETTGRNDRWRQLLYLYYANDHLRVLIFNR